MPTLTIRYFAVFREQAGCESERVSTEATNPSVLYDELQGRHRFTLPRQAIRVAINNEFESMEALLSDGDEVAYIAPVAGG